MSTHPGRIKNINGVDFSVLSPEEQKRYSLEHQNSKDEKAQNEKLAEEARKKLDDFRRKNIQ
jgi:hypothetical protein